MAIATNTLAPLSPSTALSPAQKCENPGEIESTAPTQPPYSHFNKMQKRLIVFIITFGATFSPISSFIFFPIINALSASLRVSIEKVNLTITSYMIIAGIAPAIVGDMADMTGRRIVYLLTIGIYCAANIGLAVQSSWTALFILRMLQSAGGAATIAIGYGVVSDIASPSERGGYVGAMLLGPNFATAIGPVLGGALAQRPGWRWTFWVLAIASGLCLILIFLLLPETSRFVVGNGSQRVSGIHRAFLSRVHLSRSPYPSDDFHGLEAEIIEQQENIRKPFRIPNPLASLKILWAKDSAILTLIYGIYYMNFSCLQASMSTIFIGLYGLSELDAGLVYLPFGVGSCIGAYSSGRIMNRDYRLTARDHNITINVISGDDLTIFPIQKARLRSIWYSIGVSGACTTGYGWALHSKTLCGTLLVDLNPKSPAAAQAANNIMRCSLAGGGLALLQIFLDSIGIGWTFTLLGGVCLACLGLAWLEWKYGKTWSEAMRAKGTER